MMFHCLFEQSGVFKNELIKLGYSAKDYDIKNDYDETDVLVDLFEEINKEYDGEASIFSGMGTGDYVLAFFPCTYFAAYNSLIFQGTQHQMKEWGLERKLKYTMKRHNKLNENYKAISKLVIICVRKKLKLIIEQPARQLHYLNQFWCIEPSVIDHNRTQRGDKYCKPTQYWFINCTPKYNYVELKQRTVGDAQIHNTNDTERARLRSEITPEYANTFIREFILDENEQ